MAGGWPAVVFSHVRCHAVLRAGRRAPDSISSWRPRNHFTRMHREKPQAFGFINFKRDAGLDFENIGIADRNI
jgi:hypothetical protein